MADTAARTEPHRPRSVRSEKATAWLAAAALRAGADSAVLLVRQGNTAKVIASYPDSDEIENGLVAAARRAFKEQRVVQRLRLQEAGGQRDRAAADIAVSVRVLGRPAALALRLNADSTKTDAALLADVGRFVLRRADDNAVPETSASDDSRILKALESPRGLRAMRAEDGSGRADLPADSESADEASSTKVGRPDLPPAASEAERLSRGQGAVIHGLATVLDQKDLAQSLHAFADAVAHAWRCLRVTVGIVRSQHLVVEAVSNVVDFDRRSALIVDITQVLEEARAAASTIVLPTRDKDSVPPQSHVALAEQLKNPALMTVPLVDGEQIVGAVLLERDHEFSEEEQMQVQQMALLAAPVVALKRIEAMGLVDWLGRFARRQLQAAFGSSHMGRKLGALAALAFLAFSCLFMQTFRVDAEANIEANVQRAVVASFPSFLTQVEKRAGDIVYEGEVLAQLDVEELQLDRIKWAGEYDKLTKEYRATLAQRDRSNFRVLEARRAQAQAQIDLLDAQMARATLRAPIDGVVISGDLSQSIGSPVERGQLLLEVASLEDYRLVLMVDESDIGWVQTGDEGSLRLRSLPEQSFPFTVSAITPVSEPGQGANRFRVEASLEELPDGLRPGMGGFAKIDIEPKAIGWIWTRSFVNWLRFQLWRYGF